ncbi:RDD family protein [Actinospica robiniae]|uniref:RDD family protein n=1 Tax=Actinospica robiniae TaxID=304901 RepID=UPI0012FB07C5|nr:RDD family protein [Actinospica robiniae]
MSELVVAEGVALELRPARLAGRAMALLLDAVLMLVVYVVCVIVCSAVLAGASADTTSAMRIVVFIVVVVGYPLFNETVSSGRSVGKLAAGLRVVRLDGGPERFRHALVRALTLLFADIGLPLSLGNALVSGLPDIVLFGLPGAAAVACSRQGRRIGDLLAGTIVVRERTEGGAGTLPMPPNPALSMWAAGARVQDVPPGLILAARQLISRVFELDRAAAAELTDQLSRQVAGYVTPAPPPGVAPYQYLVAVTAERYRRELLSNGKSPAYTDRRPGFRGRRPGARSAWSA